MNKVLKRTIVLFFLLLCCHSEAFSDTIGNISGQLLLDDSWERQIYVSYVETFEKEYAVSNNSVVTSAVIDKVGNFKIELDKMPPKWSLLRLHVVKKGVSPNSLVIGSRDENYFFLIARRDSEIKLYNTSETPIFKNTKVEGASYMNTFEYISKLSNYSNSIDYENSLIEKEFIEDVISEKLKAVADTCKNPLVSLYALYQTDFQANYYEDPNFYNSYLSKWKNENSSYFKSFRSKFPAAQNTPPTQNFLKYILFFTSIGAIILIGVFVYKKRGSNIKNLSIQERKIFDLVRQGMSNKEISAECNIELTTVKSHVSNIYSKLKIKSRKEAINVKIKFNSI
jgi:DNA-binding CsgD family transcriptional regulator